MKDATGELSMTAVAVIAIAAISGVFSMFIWPQIKSQILRSTYCSQAFGCEEAKQGQKTVKCYYCKNTDNAAGGSDCSGTVYCNIDA